MKKELWIGGKWRAGAQHQSLINPYSEAVIAEIAQAESSDVRDAIHTADETTAVMAALRPWERAEILGKVSSLLEARKDAAAKILAQEAAKPLTTALGEITRTIQTYQFAAEAAKNIAGEVVPMEAVPGGVGKTAFTLREPLGVIAAITPFNFPFNLVAHKLGPAFASGNTVVLKPASQTPLSAFFIAELFHEAGLPAGALNVVTGSGRVVGAQIVKDDRVKMITFTGSVEVGKTIRREAGLKRVTLELGSNSAVIIDEGTSLKNVVPRCVLGAFSYQGQVCISIQRIFVHENLYGQFLKRFLENTRELQGGDALHAESDYSAMISAGDADRVLSWVEEAKELGAKVLIGGTRNGNILDPIVLTDVPLGVRISCQEVFGPVAVVYPFSDFEDAVDHVNDSVFGLQAGVYTPTIKNAMYAAKHLEVGGVMINEIPTFRVDQMPYGGVKDSGTGREGIKYAVQEMTEMKLVVMQPEP